MADTVELLLRRAGFGPTRTELESARSQGYAATVAALTEPTGTDEGAARAPMPDLGVDAFNDLAKPTADQQLAAMQQRQDETDVLNRWWLDRLWAADQQAVEKLAFFWHGHWATSIRKVGSPQWMLAQHQKLRAADFRTMARAMIVDPALVFWLDGQLNAKGAANENLARELMELFMIGIGNYTETDVKEAGRALTGWKLDLGVPETAIFRKELFDATNKTILGATANFTASGLVDLLLRQPTCPRFIASRLWFRYGSSTQSIPAATMDRMVAAFPAPLKMLRALFEDDAFESTAGTMVKQPVEWLIGAMRQLGVRPGQLPMSTLRTLWNGLENMGQLPFVPPSVGGWPSGTAWLTTAAAQARLGLALTLADILRPSRLTAEELARLLTVETWTDRTHAALRAAGNPQWLLVLGLMSPEYQVS